MRHDRSLDLALEWDSAAVTVVTIVGSIFSSPVVLERHGVDQCLVLALAQLKLGTDGHEVAQAIDGDIVVVHGDGRGALGGSSRKGIGDQGDPACATGS